MGSRGASVRSVTMAVLYARHAPGTLKASVMGLVDDEVTLVMTDIEGSTSLWEWNDKVMDQALTIHDSILRSMLGKHYGFEVTTEGDAFTMVFHDAIDAVHWALATQIALLQAPWPSPLLEHPKACEEWYEGEDGSHLLFRGIRVRMAINTGKPSCVSAHKVTRQLEYSGSVVELTEALTSLPSGGQVMLGALAAERVAGRLRDIVLMSSHKRRRLDAMRHVLVSGDISLLDGS
ncbi:hypothetical protein WJX74_001487 [Apatococcus lobatus]|uniref:Guanylate cyclase domain-containing protein n=1 Tax=Apatococcus lobatus TaxID=904363 RepID=A0AAW1RKZ3_9CHLO